MIWEHTWPAPRLIEAAFCSPTFIEAEHRGLDLGDEGREHTILRPSCSLSWALKEDLVARTMYDRPLQYCSDPIALQVCRESRICTLTQYTLLSHADTPAGSFYFGWKRDLLYLSLNNILDRVYSKSLKVCYGELLDKFETVLVEDFIWQELSHIKYIKNFLATFEHLSTICILFTENDYFDYSENSADEGSSHVDKHFLSDGHTREVASRLREWYSKTCLAHPRWKSKKFRLIDRSGKIYSASST